MTSQSYSKEKEGTRDGGIEFPRVSKKKTMWNFIGLGCNQLFGPHQFCSKKSGRRVAGQESGSKSFWKKIHMYMMHIASWSTNMDALPATNISSKLRCLSSLFYYSALKNKHKSCFHCLIILLIICYYWRTQNICDISTGVHLTIRN